MPPCLINVQFMRVTLPAGDVSRRSISTALEHLRCHEEIAGDRELSVCLGILHTHANMLKM